MPFSSSGRLKSELESRLQDYFGTSKSIKEIAPLSGGCINQVSMIDTGSEYLVVKSNQASAFPGMFEKELHGLKILQEADCVKIPSPYFCGEVGDLAFIVLEYIEEHPASEECWQQFGQKLAYLHKHSRDYFGLEENNWIGSLHQENAKLSTWAEFFREKRLKVQVELAQHKNLLTPKHLEDFEALYAKLDSIFPEEKSSLLHGDLWNGNIIQGECIHCIDPAVYFGHREMDLAMTKLFGGFPPPFYQAYKEVYPLEADWEHRMNLANLYPLLVHLNLFGNAYLAQIESILKAF